MYMKNITIEEIMTRFTGSRGYEKGHGRTLCVKYVTLFLRWHDYARLHTFLVVQAFLDFRRLLLMTAFERGLN